MSKARGSSRRDQINGSRLKNASEYLISLHDRGFQIWKYKEKSSCFWRQRMKAKVNARNHGKCSETADQKLANIESRHVLDNHAAGFNTFAVKHDEFHSNDQIACSTEAATHW